MNYRALQNALTVNQASLTSLMQALPPTHPAFAKLTAVLEQLQAVRADLIASAIGDGAVDFSKTGPLEIIDDVDGSF